MSNSNLKNKTLGILSSYTENCGNASYTKQLIEELGQHFGGVECIHLNQKLIHAGVKVDTSIINQVKKYDFLNMQYELGLFGKTDKKAYRLIEKIIRSHNNITITVHSYFINPELMYGDNLVGLKFNIKTVLRKWKIIKKPKNYTSLLGTHSRFLLLLIKMIKSGKKISLIVHRKELADYFEKFGIPVRHHPIVLATNKDINKFNNSGTRSAFVKKFHLDESKIYIGVFGFLGAYKGFDVVLEALKSLPRNYQLIMCCQRHPMDNKNIYKPSRKDADNINGQFFMREFCPDNQTILLNSIIEKNHLSDRVIYINHLIDEEDFKSVISGVDIPIFPYYEVGQGGSGPISYAMHLNYGAKIIASRTKAFEEYCEDYYPKCLTFFDQGNHIELGHKILSIKSLKNNILAAEEKYGVHSNVKIYLDSTLETS